MYANVCAIHCVACVYARVCTRYLLVFDGVKMGASIYVNKVLLGQTSDQFLRYTFPLTKAILQTGVMSTPDDTTTSISSTHTLTVEFSPNIDCDGRWMGCSGGWDWVWSKNRPVFFFVNRETLNGMGCHGPPKPGFQRYSISMPITMTH